MQNLPINPPIPSLSTPSSPIPPAAPANNANTIFYTLGDSLYINMTNQCPCACQFCIRNTTHGVGDAPSLWLQQEPTLPEIFAAFDLVLSQYLEQSVDQSYTNTMAQIVFCGYGEPLTRGQDVILVAQYIKQQLAQKAPTWQVPLRLNTNGLIYLIDPAFKIQELQVMDAISISLNADDPEEYHRLVRPCFGVKSFAHLLAFIKDVGAYAPVTLSVMEDLAPVRIQRCKALAKELGATLRVRTYM